MRRCITFLLSFYALLSSAGGVSFSREVAPILQRHCVACHKEGKAKGKYRLDTYEQLRKELEPGDLESELLFRITTEDEEERMPAEADPLAGTEIAVIRKWIAEGAKYDGEDPESLLSAIIPVKAHPVAPESYPRPLGVTAMVFGGGGTETLYWRLPRDPGLESREWEPPVPDPQQRAADIRAGPFGGWGTAGRCHGGTRPGGRGKGLREPDRPGCGHALS